MFQPAPALAKCRETSPPVAGYSSSTGQCVGWSGCHKSSPHRWKPDWDRQMRPGLVWKQMWLSSVLHRLQGRLPTMGWLFERFQGRGDFEDPIARNSFLQLIQTQGPGPTQPGRLFFAPVALATLLAWVRVVCFESDAQA